MTELHEAAAASAALEAAADAAEPVLPQKDGPEIVVRASGVRKRFGGNEVLKGVDLEVHRGKVVVILGPSGSGKSTLLRCINHLERLDEGSIQVDGVQVGYVEKNGVLYEAPYRVLAEQRRRIGMVFQSFNLFPHMTVLENVMEAPVHVHGEDPAVVKARALKLLKRVGLLEKANEYPRRLSGGQQQRVSIARALCIQPDLLLFDEPTSALDPQLVGEVLAVIRSLADEGFTMIVVTHEIPFARDVANWVVFMADGVVVEEGKPADVLDHPKSARLREFLKRYLSHRADEEGAEAAA